MLRSPTVRPVDDLPKVWAIPCFFVGREHRGRGLGTTLLEAAVDHAAARGAAAVEGYPVEPAGHRGATELYYGTVSMFANAGFRQIAARSARRRVMRRVL